jgi:hypothetical protein
MEQYDQTVEIWERFVAAREVANNAGRPILQLGL